MDSPSPLHLCADLGNLEACNVLLGFGALPHIELRDGASRETPLLTAVRCGNVEIVERLIKVGAPKTREVRRKGCGLEGCDNPSSSQLIRFLEIRQETDNFPH